MKERSRNARLSLQPEPTLADLAVLKPRERKVLVLRQAMSLQAISDELDVSKERVRQIQNRAIEKFSKRISGLQVVIVRTRRQPTLHRASMGRTPITAEIIGERLQLLLKAAGMTQQQLADAVETSQPTINDYLHGRVMPTLSILERIALALGARLRQLVDPD